MTGFVCQSFLKERRRPPTGGLREALEESLGGMGFHVGISPKFPIPLLTTYMHHEIELNLSGSSLATVLTDLHNQVAFRQNLVKCSLKLNS